MKILRPNSNRHKRVDLRAKIINFVNLGCIFRCATSAKNPRSMYARVMQAMAQFVLKIDPYHGANPNTRNGAHLRSPSPIMAPGFSVITYLTVSSR